MKATDISIELHAQAVCEADDWARNVKDGLASLNADWRTCDLRHEAPEMVARALGDSLAGQARELIRHQVALLGYLAQRVDLEATPEVQTEVLGRDIKVIVKVHDTWIGTLTIFDPGGELACRTHQTCYIGSRVEANGDLMAEWFCFDPTHKNPNKE